jgi:hypothetical protein
MSISKKKSISIIIVGVFLLSISILRFSAFDNLKSVKNEENLERLSTSYDFGDDFFNGNGDSLNVSLYGNRNESKALSIKEEDLIISNEKNGWNLSKFRLNFTEIYASDANIPYEIRNDGSEEIFNSNTAYANSFQIPNSCYIRNLSMFIQYPGGYFEFQGTANRYNTTKPSEFSIRIYNATLDNSRIIPDKPMDNFEEDEIFFNLTEYPHAQPARWYQSNFTTNNILNISKTFNNTWFAVFEPIIFPSGGFFPIMNPYYYYAEEELGDNYKINLLKNETSWGEIAGKNGMFKINYSPIDINPNPEEINISVFDNPVDANGLYYHNSFLENENDEFIISINSPWFGNVELNVSFEGEFRYDTKSVNVFRAIDGSDVLWNSTLEIREYNDKFYNNSANFYKPYFWNFSSVYKDGEIYEDVKNNSEFVKLNNISNDTWIITYNQKNNIISPNFTYSTNQIDWNDFSDKEFINATHYINISSTFNNSNGDALLHVYLGSSTEADLAIQEEITIQNHYFPLWRFKFNMSSNFENDTLAEIRLMTNNGTVAGIVSKSIRIILDKSQTDLRLISNLRQSYIYGDELVIEALLTTEQSPIVGDKINFKIIETYSGGITNQVILDDITDDEGVARISYSVKDNIQSIQISTSYNGTLDYEETEFSSGIIPVRSALEQFFIDFMPYLFILIGIVVGGATYYTIRKYKYKKNMEIWRKKTQLFANVLKIELILVIHKNSGSALIQRSFSDIPIDGNLISGFLQAVSSFKYEIKQESEKSKKESILLDYQDYNILLKDGEFIRIALILNSDPSKNLEKSLDEFIIDFENQAYSDLKQFKGNVAPFKEYFGELVDKHFEMSFIRPHVINENPPTITLSSFQERLLNVAKTLQQDNGQFYISQLLNYLLSAQPDEPKERFIANIYDLRQYGFIKPL